jgi:uncharacterized protein (DUF1697 family)
LPRYFAFLRGMNLGGHTVKNTQLIQIFAAAGIKDAEPFIASAEAPLTKKVAAALAQTLGYDVRTYLRTREELAAIAALEPFTPARRKSATVLLVGLLEAPATAAQKKTTLAYANEESDFHLKGREIYWLCQVGQSQSAFFRVPFEKRLGAQVTWRNLNTVNRLLAKYPE